MAKPPFTDVAARMSLAGAVPLDPRPAAPQAAPSEHVIDVTEASFARDVVERSRQVPVVIDFWASWCGPCRQLSPVLERLAAQSGGSWVLAKIDVDANPRLASAAGVQGIPAVKAVVDGAIVAEFTGALPEAQVRQWLEGLAQAAATGEAAPPQESDSDLDQAVAALERGDLVEAHAAFSRVLERRPADPQATVGLSRVALLQRAERHDPSRLQEQLQADPADADARNGLADLLVLSDRVEEAFALLIEGVRATAGPAREAMRSHLIELFGVLGEGDPRAVAGRRELANALF